MCDMYYSKMRVRNIIKKQIEQLEYITKHISLALDRADLLEADRNAKDV